MKPNRRVLFAVILAVVGGTTACERTDGLGQLTGPSTPQYAKIDGNWQLQILKRGRLSSTEMVCSRPISKQGGTLTFDGGTLEVSRNAVSSATIFCAANHPGDDLQITLSAYDVGSNAEVHTFRVPVKLTVDLTDVAIDDWSHIVVVYLNPDGSFESMPTAQNRNGLTVTGLLPHFSDYGVGTQRNYSTLVPQ